MTAQKPSGSVPFRWSTLKGLTALALFIASASLVECLIVFYAISIGVRDEATFQAPLLGFTISPLFHLVPASIVIVLAASWACMVEYLAMRPLEKVRQSRKAKGSEKTGAGLSARISAFLGKMKAGLLEVKGVKGAVTVLLVFLALATLISVLANPWLVYRAFAHVYQSNPQLLGFVTATNNALQSFIQTVAPLGWVCSAFDNAIKAAAPGIRASAAALGSLIKPLADLPAHGKYLVFQNLAAWFSALAVLLYGVFVRKSYRYKRR
ncbi:MAG: hypothetical protein QXL77_04625 [Candidatus Bathyarchaeia archaeon]